jgi:hypothetical protein
MFEQLDFLYTPSRDVAADVDWFRTVADAHLVFAIEAMGTRVAMLELTSGPPRIVLTDHLDGDRPILVYRVQDLERAVEELRGRGWQDGRSLEIPQGPVRSFVTPGGHRLAVYQLTRPGVVEGFAGRRDF